MSPKRPTSSPLERADLVRTYGRTSATIRGTSGDMLTGCGCRVSGLRGALAPLGQMFNFRLRLAYIYRQNIRNLPNSATRRLASGLQDPGKPGGTPNIDRFYVSSESHMVEEFPNAAYRNNWAPKLAGPISRSGLALAGKWVYSNLESSGQCGLINNYDGDHCAVSQQSTWRRYD